MNTKNYTKISIPKTFWKAFLALSLLLSMSVKAQDCMLLPMTLQQRVQTSPLIIEGEVMSQQSFWGQGHKTIYTLNKVKVYKIFKGNVNSGIIDVITEGGTVGMDRIVHSATLSLAVGDMGVLLCIPNPFADSGVAGYTPYGSLAGFIRYEQDGSAHDPYTKYDKIDADLHKAIKDITNHKIRKVANNPKLGAIFNKNSGGGNANKQAGGGMQIEATPTISGFTPTSIAAGTGSTITITGTNFGASQGTGGVEFRNADDGGATWIRPLSTDYVSWSSTQIVVKVPSTNAAGFGAGTGQIRVVNSDASSNTATSSQTLTVTYSYTNLIFDNTARMATHIKDNTAGGYTFLLDQATFASNLPAVSKFRLTLDRWTCTSGINWLIGGNISAGVADDGANVACYSASLPASVLARCTSYYSGCGSTPYNWYVREIDVAVKSNMPAGNSWYYGTGSPSATEYDFETVILHEMGHGHQLNHVIDAAAVMHYGVAAGQVKRTLNAGDIAGSTFVKNRDVSVGGICGNSAMTLLGCGAGNGAPIVNFSADRTNITVGCSVNFTSESLPQATSWSWNFNGGATNSTAQNPTVTFNTPGTYTVALTATNANGSNTLTRTNYIVVSPLTCSATSSNWSGSNADYNHPISGQFIGHNGGGDLGFADKFLYCGTATKLTQLKYYFNISNGTGNITAKVWNANGAGGAPGTELFSQTVAISTIPDLGTPLTVTIPSGLLLTSDYYIGFEITYSGSAVSLLSNLQGESVVSSAWRKSSSSVWESYEALYGSSLSLRIESVIDNAPTATITAGGPTTFCTGSNVLLSANTGTGLSYLWFKDTVTTGITTPTFTATTSGSYTVRVTYAGCSTTSAGTTVTANFCASTNANLSNLLLSAGTLNPVFSSVTTGYAASVGNTTTSITVTPTVADATATVRVNGVVVTSGSPSGAIALNVGSNVITTIVTAQDGTTTKTYTVTVTRAPSSNANLSNLILSSGTMNPLFAQATTVYTASVSNATTSITVAPTVADATATVTVNSVSVVSGSPSGSIALSVGSNIITTVVTAQDGTTKTYTVTVTREADSNADLSNLVLSTGILNPVFASATIIYTATVPVSVTGINVTPTASTATSTITVNGTPVNSGSPSGNIALSVGSNIIQIAVTAQNGSVKVYVVDVTRETANSNANLSGLTVSSGSLNPVFASGTLNYNVLVASNLSSITVTPTASAGTSTITVNGLSVNSGNPSTAIALNSGNTTITIIVTAQNGATQTYTIVISKSPTAVISGTQTVCSTNTNATLSVNLTGIAPWNLFVSDGTQTNVMTAFSSPFTFNVNPSSTTTYTVVHLTDANTSAQPGDLTGSATVTVADAITYYADADGDGFGNVAISQNSCNGAPIIFGNPAVLNNTDCADNNPSVYRLGNFYRDTDNDGYDTGFFTQCYGESIPLGYSTATLGTDCNDNDETVHTEFSFYADNDNDTYGSGSLVSVCAPDAVSPPSGYSINSTDCDDNDNQVYQSELLFFDGDGDGYHGSSGPVCYGESIPGGYSSTTLGIDCDDNNNEYFQSVTLYVDGDGDGYDAGFIIDCVGATPPLGFSFTTNGLDCDDANPLAHQSFPFYADNDGDTFGTGSLISVCAVDANTPPTGYADNNTDCEDNDLNVYQSSSLFIDIDGDGYDTGSAVVCYGADIPDGYVSTTLGTDCNDTDSAIFRSATLFIDADGDGYDAGSASVCYGALPPPGFIVSSLGSDCNDADALLNQQFAFYIDNDGDGFGAGSSVMICAPNGTTAPIGYALNNTDCNDNENTVYQSAALYVDADFDGYTSGATQLVCYGASIPFGFLSSSTAIDCNDSEAAIRPNAVEIPFNGVDDNCNGFVDETGNIGVTTTLLPASCGTTLVAIGSLIGIQTVGGHPITGYRIRATNGSEVQIIEKTVPHFSMTQFASYAYATTYVIDIQLQRAGIWLTNWGTPCLVSTPAILEQGGAATVSPSQCGIVLPKINTLIATSSIAGVTGYRFRVTNLIDPAGPNAVQHIDRTQNWFSLQMLTRYNYGTTYRIEVAVKTTGTYGGFGAPCEVSSPPAPTLINCGGTVVSGTATVAATSLSGATQYRFQISRNSDGATTTIDRNSNWFIFNSVPATMFTAGGLYNVRVAVMTTGTWSPFGDACQITAPGGGTAKGIAAGGMANDVFKATVYPSPFTTDFGIDVTSPSTQDIVIKVYDMLGKLIESREIRFMDLDIEKVGDKYPSGVYTVVVSQDDIVKVLRAVKR